MRLNEKITQYKILNLRKWGKNHRFHRTAKKVMRISVRICAMCLFFIQKKFFLFFVKKIVNLGQQKKNEGHQSPKCRW